MRQARTHARRGVGLAAVLAAMGCATAEPVRGAHGTPPDAADAARREIAARIASTVEATKRLDIDALAGGGGARRRQDGGQWSLAEARAAVAAELSGVERTVSLVVHIDSLRMTSDSSALVYTVQRWDRVLLATDGTRHRALTQNWLEQKWARGADGWRGSGEVRVTRPGTSTSDGGPYVVVDGGRKD